MRGAAKLVLALALVSPLLTAATALSERTTGGTAPAITPVSAEEYANTLEAMRPPKRKRPVVAVLANNDGAETTDFLVPYGVLVEAGIGEVLAVAPADEPIRLRPSLRVKPQATLASFNQRFPDGADYVIVPAMRPNDPVILSWIKDQAAKGATIMGICAGSLVLSEAGLLHGRRATGYWLNIDQLRRANPTMEWVPNRRFVADRGVITTAGITASLPASLAVVEAIAGRAKADAVARALGVATWDANHESGAFGAAERRLMDAAASRRGHSRPTPIGVPVAEGIDEIALAFTADAFSRPHGTLAVAVAEDLDPITTKRGLTLLPERQAGAENAPKEMVPAFTVAAPAAAMDASLDKIAEIYGPERARLVALQMEYPRRSFTPASAKQDGS